MTDIEILKYEMDRTVKEKNREIMKIQSKIFDIEEKNFNLQKKLHWYEDYLKKLRQKRELAEIECYKEILKIHDKLEKIKNRFVHDDVEDKFSRG